MAGFCNDVYEYSASIIEGNVLISTINSSR